METLIELVLFAAAAYGIKSYLFKPEAIHDREIFSSRGTTFVKRLVCKQTAPNRVAANIDDQLSLEANPIESTVSANLAQKVTEPPLISQPILTPQSETSESHLPEDSILKRHYLAHLAAEQTASHNPYPTDSILRRHYTQRQIALLNVVASTEATAGIMTHTASQNPLAKQKVQMTIPADSILKRHFLSHLQHQIETQLQPCPTDAVLKRHHQQLIQSRIDACLAEFS